MGEFRVFLYAGRTPKMATRFIVLAAAALVCVYGDADAEPKADGQVYGYTLAPAYGPVEPVHHAPVHHAPAAYHEPKPDHYEPPKCSIDNPKTWCLEDPEYPTYEIEHALQYHYEGVQAIYKDVLANTENS